MKRLLLSFLLVGSAWATPNAFTPFYMISGNGDNLNSGSTPDATANTTYTSKVTANGWDGVSVFTVASGNPSTDTGVTNGAFASIYVTSGSVTSSYIARITNTTTTTFTMDRAAFSGAPPAADGTGATSAKIGGAWSGPLIPQTNCIFPFNFVSGSMTNATGDCPMINVKGTWWVTNTLVESLQKGTVWWRGYTNTVGDGGLANIYGSNSIAGYNLLQITTGINRNFANFQFATNGNSGGAAQHAVYNQGAENTFYNCTVHDARCGGFDSTGSGIFISCDAWHCGQAGNLFGGFILSAQGAIAINCTSHHNSTAGASGFVCALGTAIGCVSATNNQEGFIVNATQGFNLINCSAWGNGRHGINFSSTSGTIADPVLFIVQNCSLVGNTGAAITNTGAASPAYYVGLLFNNGFGSGSQANGSDVEARLKGMLSSNAVTFAANQTPWNAPFTGDFSITSATAGAKGAGYGTYLTTFPAGYGGTVGFPDIGAAQSSDTNSVGGTVGYAQ